MALVGYCFVPSKPTLLLAAMPWPRLALIAKLVIIVAARLIKQLIKVVFASASVIKLVAFTRFFESFVFAKNCANSESRSPVVGWQHLQS